MKQTFLSCVLATLLIVFSVKSMVQFDKQLTSQESRPQKEVLSDLGRILKVKPDFIALALAVEQSKKPIPILDTITSDQRELTKQLINTRLADSENDTLLLKFIKQSAADVLNIQVLRNFLILGASASVKDHLGTAPLHFLVCKENAQEIVKLISDYEKVDLSVEDMAGKTPLHYAVICLEKPNDGVIKKAVVRSLLQLGADVTKEDKQKNTPLDLAVKSTNRNLIELLRSYNAPVSQRTLDNAKNNSDIVELLKREYQPKMLMRSDASRNLRNIFQQ